MWSKMYMYIYLTWEKILLLQLQTVIVPWVTERLHLESITFYFQEIAMVVIKTYLEMFSVHM